MEQKKIEVEALVLEEEPDLLFISEANMRDAIAPEFKFIEGYNLITPNTMRRMGYSRLVLFVREGVKLDVMENCMSDDLPAIWVKLTTRGRKPLVIGGLYREFHQLLQPLPNMSDEKKPSNRQMEKDNFRVEEGNEGLKMCGYRGPQFGPS